MGSVVNVERGAMATQNQVSFEKLWVAVQDRTAAQCSTQGLKDLVWFATNSFVERSVVCDSWFQSGRTPVPKARHNLAQHAAAGGVLGIRFIGEEPASAGDTLPQNEVGPWR